jgi:hypothetical protein
LPFFVFYKLSEEPMSTAAANADAAHDDHLDDPNDLDALLATIPDATSTAAVAVPGLGTPGSMASHEVLLGQFRPASENLTAPAGQPIGPTEDAANQALLAQLDADTRDRRSTPEPIVSSDFLFRQQIDAARERLKGELDSADRASLRPLYRHHVWAGRREEAWVLAEHFTRLGVPPCFRPSPYRDGEARIPREDILLHDAQWIVTRYPKHQVFRKRHANLFKSSRFQSAAKYLLWTGLHDPGFYVHALALTPDQQTECVFLRSAPVRDRMAVIDRLKDEALERIRISHMRNARARKQGDPEGTITRRHDIWLCGSMAQWLPTRTAELYKMLRAETITRSLAGKLISEVHDAYPESKPVVKRRRRSKAMASRSAALPTT